MLAWVDSCPSLVIRFGGRCRQPGCCVRHPSCEPSEEQNHIDLNLKSLTLARCPTCSTQIKTWSFEGCVFHPLLGVRTAALPVARKDSLSSLPRASVSERGRAESHFTSEQIAGEEGSEQVLSRIFSCIPRLARNLGHCQPS